MYVYITHDLYITNVCMYLSLIIVIIIFIMLPIGLFIIHSFAENFFFYSGSIFGLKRRLFSLVPYIRNSLIRKLLRQCYFGLRKYTCMVMIVGYCTVKS